MPFRVENGGLRVEGWVSRAVASLPSTNSLKGSSKHVPTRAVEKKIKKSHQDPKTLILT